MIKKIITNTMLLFTICLISCTAQIGFPEASKKVYNDRISRTKQYLKHEKYAHKLRKELYNEGKLNFFSTKKPLFIIEGYDLETDNTFVCIMNTTGELNFKFSLKAHNILEQPIYSENLKKMIFDWDIASIKSEEKKKSLDGLDIIVNKVFFNSDGSVRELKNMSFDQFDGALNIY